MIAVDTLTRSITVQLAGAVTTKDASWVSTYAPPVGLNVTDVGTTSGVNPITIVPSPTGVAGGVNELLSFSLWNSDTVAIILTITFVDSVGTNHILQSCTIQPGESIGYEDKRGWFGIDAKGNEKVASNAVQVSTALSTAQAASRAASNLSGSLASVSVVASSASQNISILTLSISAVSSEVLVLSGNLSINTVFLTATQVQASSTAGFVNATLSSVASRTKSSFGW